MSNPEAPKLDAAAFATARRDMEGITRGLRAGANLLRERANDIDLPTLVELVAGWIEGEAHVLSGMEPFVDLLNSVVASQGGPETFLRFGKTESGEYKFYGDTVDHAVSIIQLAAVTA